VLSAARIFRPSLVFGLQRSSRDSRNRRSSYGENPRRTSLSATVERSIQVERGADQGEVGKGLREIAERFASCAGLFRVESQVICIPQHLLEQEPGFIVRTCWLCPNRIRSS
jgi:hypothetical protein